MSNENDYFKTLREELDRQERESSCKWSKLDRKRRHYLKSKYNLDREGYNKLINKKGLVCNICGTDKNGNRKYFHLDHCHVTDSPRGFLCSRCNSGLGFFRDNPEILSDAIKYLKTYHNELWHSGQWIDYRKEYEKKYKIKINPI